MRQRFSGLGATKRHMKLDRSAMLLTGLGLIGWPVFLLFWARGKPQVIALQHPPAVLLAYDQAGAAGIDVALGDVEQGRHLGLEVGSDLRRALLAGVEVAHGGRIAWRRPLPSPRYVRYMFRMPPDLPSPYPLRDLFDVRRAAFGGAP
jgi:hypothetical protein